MRVADAVLAAGLATGAALVLRVPRLRPGPGAVAAQVLVVIPARDEADVLDGLLDDLSGQRLAPARIVVVDDGSRDGTAALVEARDGVELRRAGARPTGWNPKSWAIHQGLQGADEDEIVLLDADVRLSGEALAAILFLRRATGAWVSVAPRHDTGQAIEALSLPFNLVALMGAGGGQAAFGPCLAMSRTDYLAVGGHAAVADDLLDDVALAQRARSRGHAIALRRGGSIVRYRMYRGGWNEVVDGWTKNISAGATRIPPVRATLVGAWVTATLAPLAALVTGGLPTSELGLRWAASGLSMYVLGRGVGRFPWWTAPAGPLLAGAFVAVFGRSATRAARGRPVVWKGRHLG